MEQKLTREEREVHLWFDPVDKVWLAEVQIPAYMSKFEKQGWELVETRYYNDGTVMSKEYKAGQEFITIRDVKKKRLLTDEEKKRRMEWLNGGEQ